MIKFLDKTIFADDVDRAILVSSQSDMMLTKYEVALLLASAHVEAKDPINSVHFIHDLERVVLIFVRSDLPPRSLICEYDSSPAIAPYPVFSMHVDQATWDERDHIEWPVSCGYFTTIIDQTPREPENGEDTNS